MPIKATRILYNDQAEYYFVCPTCRVEFGDMQFAGSTRGGRGWREASQKQLEDYMAEGGECEFCGPNGNGGWMIDGKFPAAERRDARRVDDSNLTGDQPAEER